MTDAENRHDRLWTRATLVVLLGLAALPAVTPAGAQTGSPMADGPQEGYPDASRWPGGDYQELSGRPRLQGTMEAAGAPGSAAGALAASELPEGLTLLPGTSIQAMAGEPAGEKWFVTYPLAYNGVPVSKYSDVMVIVDGAGNPLYLRKRNLPASVDASRPAVRPGDAVAAARSHAGAALGETVEASEPALEVWVEPSLAGRLAWTLTLASPSLTDPKARRYWISAAGEPRVLAWESEIYHSHSGVVSGFFWATSSMRPTDKKGFQDLVVGRTTDHFPYYAETVTGVDGAFRYTDANADLAAVAGKLRGPYCSILDLGEGRVLQSKASGTPGSSIEVLFKPSGFVEFQTAQTSAFYWTNASWRLAQTILGPGPGRPFMGLLTRVNIDEHCNAFYSRMDTSINFFRAGEDCPNTAYSDVVAHEYGHGIDDWHGGILDGSYSEGFGDVMAILLTRQACTGRDFFGLDTCLRKATDTNLWPPMPGEGIHLRGKRYAQFVWELVKELKRTISEEEAYKLAQRLVLAAAAGNPSSIPDAVRISFLADDTDGNLANGTPHCRELAAAADSRRIPNPGCPSDRLAYVWAHDPAASSYTPNPQFSYNSAGGPITITRSGTGTYSIRFAGLKGPGPVGGNVQVTAYGTGNETCKLVSWGAGGPDLVVDVRCFDLGGANADAAYTALVTWR